MSAYGYARASTIDQDTGRDQCHEFCARPADVAHRSLNLRMQALNLRTPSVLRSDNLGSGHGSSIYVRMSEKRGFFGQTQECPTTWRADEIVDKSVSGQESGQMFPPRSRLAYVKLTFVSGARIPSTCARPAVPQTSPKRQVPQKQDELVPPGLFAQSNWLGRR